MVSNSSQCCLLQVVGSSLSATEDPPYRGLDGRLNLSRLEVLFYRGSLKSEMPAEVSPSSSDRGSNSNPLIALS
ncbi:hypothetical protein TNCV_2184211 [Trichonephila clavipes]|nr:hypothetical protein TNCV_2184211 [Trichonephila clavipes]